ncbi:MAG TPA: DUF6624 domain-containing protein [Bacteroidia bacterium]|jgi:hypothetical protein|nr:DUF6624 domain-containing protein [Bacteroidia bacterium]
MRLKFYFLAFFLVTAIISKAQVQFILSKGDSLREQGDLRGAIEAFKKEYQINPSNKTNLYNYACALALTGQNDSCFKYLNLSIRQKISVDPLVDRDFVPLKSDLRWKAFQDTLALLVQKKSPIPIKDLEYAKKLWEMRASDQAYYKEIDLAEKKTGRNSTVVQALWFLKRKLNEENQEEFELLVINKGWPKISDVGNIAASSAFLIIQHSNAEKQKKYLPIIKKLCEENEASWEEYALMYDRVQVGDGKKQKYGSQVRFNDQTQKFELFPLEDEIMVDEWRKEVGLPPLAEYVANWEIKFEPRKKK